MTGFRTLSFLVLILYLGPDVLSARSESQERRRPRPPAVEIGLQVVAQDLVRPVYVISAPDNASRLYVVEQPGRVRIVENGALRSAPLLDLTERIEDGGEKGMLSLAFDPRHWRNRRFYVFYYTLEDHTVVTRFRTRKNNPFAIQDGNEKEILSVFQPYSNHNGGQLQFGPDGMLYIGLGDGGSGGDPQNFAQNLGTYLGKIHRLDVRRLPVKSPPDNPFVKRTDAVHAIWAYGLRNPWRFSFDRQTGDLWIADVGQNRIEEVNFQAAGAKGGANYGWRILEGSQCFNPSEGCSSAGTVLPVHEYSHSVGASITGGYVYRGKSIPELVGHYFFADFVSRRIWSFKLVNGAKTQFTDWTDMLRAPDGSGVTPSSFGEDANGELYVCDFAGGQVFRIVPR